MLLCFFFCIKLVYTLCLINLWIPAQGINNQILEEKTVILPRITGMYVYRMVIETGKHV